MLVCLIEGTGLVPYVIAAQLLWVGAAPEAPPSRV
jgi:hypothetical protein